MTVSAALWHDSKWTDNKYQLAPLWCLSYAKAFSGWGEARGSRLTSVQLALCLRENGTRKCGVNELQWRKWNCQLFLWSPLMLTTPTCGFSITVDLCCRFDSRLGRLSGTMTVVNSSHQSSPPFSHHWPKSSSFQTFFQFWSMKEKSLGKKSTILAVFQSGPVKYSMLVFVFWWRQWRFGSLLESDQMCVWSIDSSVCH